MTMHDHDRAADLIARRGVDEVAAPDAAWLELHLSECQECAGYAEAFQQTGQRLRSYTITASSALVTRTQSLVRVRAEQLREQQTRMVLVAVSFCIGVLFSTASAWLWWKAGDSVVRWLGLPESIVAPGVLLFWLLPAIAVALLMVILPPSMFTHFPMHSLSGEPEREIR